MAFLSKKMALAGVALASALALGGCYDDGYGYGGVGYASDYGYGPGYYYDGYGYPGYGYGYGWYDDFYYPGDGIYVYDRGGRRHRWTDAQRHYWQEHRGNGRPGGDGHWQGRPGGGNGDHHWQGRPGGGNGDHHWQGRPGAGGPAGGPPHGWSGGQRGQGMSSAPQPRASAPSAPAPRGGAGLLGARGGGQRDHR